MIQDKADDFYAVVDDAVNKSTPTGILHHESRRSSTTSLYDLGIKSTPRPPPTQILSRTPDILFNPFFLGPAALPGCVLKKNCCDDSPVPALLSRDNSYNASATKWLPLTSSTNTCSSAFTCCIPNTPNGIIIPPSFTCHPSCPPNVASEGTCVNNTFLANKISNLMTLLTPEKVHSPLPPFLQSARGGEDNDPEGTPPPSLKKIKFNGSDQIEIDKNQMAATFTPKNGYLTSNLPPLEYLNGVKLFTNIAPPPAAELFTTIPTTLLTKNNNNNSQGEKQHSQIKSNSISQQSNSFQNSTKILQDQKESSTQKNKVILCNNNRKANTKIHQPIATKIKKDNSIKGDITIPKKRGRPKPLTPVSNKDQDMSEKEEDSIVSPATKFHLSSFLSLAAGQNRTKNRELRSLQADFVENPKILPDSVLIDLLPPLASCKTTKQKVLKKPKIVGTKAPLKKSDASLAQAASISPTTKSSSLSPSSPVRSPAGRNNQVKRVIEPAGGIWNCSVCTFRNVANSFSCKMCGARKGTSTRKPKVSPLISAQQQTINAYKLSSATPSTCRRSPIFSPPPLTPQKGDGVGGKKRQRQRKLVKKSADFSLHKNDVATVNSDSSSPTTSEDEDDTEMSNFSTSIEESSLTLTSTTTNTSGSSPIPDPVDHFSTPARTSSSSIQNYAAVTPSKKNLTKLSPPSRTTKTRLPRTNKASVKVVVKEAEEDNKVGTVVAAAVAPTVIQTSVCITIDNVAAEFSSTPLSSVAVVTSPKTPKTVDADFSLLKKYSHKPPDHGLSPGKRGRRNSSRRSSLVEESVNCDQTDSFLSLKKPVKKFKFKASSPTITTATSMVVGKESGPPGYIDRLTDLQTSGADRERDHQLRNPFASNFSHVTRASQYTTTKQDYLSNFYHNVTHRYAGMKVATTVPVLSSSSSLSSSVLISKSNIYPLETTTTSGTTRSTISSISTQPQTSCIANPNNHFSCQPRFGQCHFGTQLQLTTTSSNNFRLNDKKTVSQKSAWKFTSPAVPSGTKYNDDININDKNNNYMMETWCKYIEQNFYPPKTGCGNNNSNYSIATTTFEHGSDAKLNRNSSSALLGLRDFKKGGTKSTEVTPLRLTSPGLSEDSTSLISLLNNDIIHHEASATTSSSYRSHKTLYNMYRPTFNVYNVNVLPPTTTSTPINHPWSSMFPSPQPPPSFDFWANPPSDNTQFQYPYFPIFHPQHYVNSLFGQRMPGSTSYYQPNNINQSQIQIPRASRYDSQPSNNPLFWPLYHHAHQRSMMINNNNQHYHRNNHNPAAAKSDSSRKTQSQSFQDDFNKTPFNIAALSSSQEDYFNALCLYQAFMNRSYPPQAAAADHHNLKNAPYFGSPTPNFYQHLHHNQFNLPPSKLFTPPPEHLPRDFSFTNPGYWNEYTTNFMSKPPFSADTTFFQVKQPQPAGCGDNILRVNIELPPFPRPADADAAANNALTSRQQRSTSPSKEMIRSIDKNIVGLGTKNLNSNTKKNNPDKGLLLPPGHVTPTKLLIEGGVHSSNDNIPLKYHHSGTNFSPSENIANFSQLCLESPLLVSKNLNKNDDGGRNFFGTRRNSELLLEGGDEDVSYTPHTTFLRLKNHPIPSNKDEDTSYSSCDSEDEKYLNDIRKDLSKLWAHHNNRDSDSPLLRNFKYLTETFPDYLDAHILPRKLLARLKTGGVHSTLNNASNGPTNVPSSCPPILNHQLKSVTNSPEYKFSTTSIHDQILQNISISNDSINRAFDDKDKQIITTLPSSTTHISLSAYDKTISNHTTLQSQSILQRGSSLNNKSIPVTTDINRSNVLLIKSELEIPKNLTPNKTLIKSSDSLTTARKKSRQGRKPKQKNISATAIFNKKSLIPAHECKNCPYDPSTIIEREITIDNGGSDDISTTVTIKEYRIIDSIPSDLNEL